MKHRLKVYNLRVYVPVRLDRHGLAVRGGDRESHLGKISEAYPLLAH